MSGGFFRGTSADQDTRFSNKQAKLLKSQKFAPELDHLVDVTKVNMDVVKPWIASRVTEILGFEDEVLINFIYGLLDKKLVNGKEIQIQITGFMEKNTGKFMKELWVLLLSAQENASGVPQQFLDAKEEEIRKKKAEADRITHEIQKKNAFEQEKLKKMDGEVHVAGDVDEASDSILKHLPWKASSPQPEGDKDSDEMNGSGGKNSDRSISRSPQSRGHSISPQRYRSPRKHSLSPHNYSPRRPWSPFRWRSPHSRRRSLSPRRRGSSSLVQRRSPSPRRHRSPSPVRPRSPTPVRRQSPPPMRRRTPSPLLRRRSPSPMRRRSALHSCRRFPTPQRRSPPLRWRSPSPSHRSPSLVRMRTPPSRSPKERCRSPVRPPRQRNRTHRPYKSRGPAYRSCRSSSGDRDILSNGVGSKQYRDDYASKRVHVRRSPVHHALEREEVELSVQGRYGLDPTSRQLPISLRSPQRDPRDRSDTCKTITAQSLSPEKSPSQSESSPHTGQTSPSDDRSSFENTLRQTQEQTTHAHGTSPMRKTRDWAAHHDNAETDREEETSHPSGSGVKRTDSSRERTRHSPTGSQRKITMKDFHREECLPEGLAGRRSGEARGHQDYIELRKKDGDRKSEKVSTRTGHPRSPQLSSHMVEDMEYGPGRIERERLSLDRVPHEQPSAKQLERDIPSNERTQKSHSRKDYRTDEKKLLHLHDVDATGKTEPVQKSVKNVDHNSDSEHIEKRKHKRSKRHEVASESDASYDSQMDERKEAKRRKKEEKRRLRKEERRWRREERHRRREERRACKLKTKSVDTVTPPSDIDKSNFYADVSDGDTATRRGFQLRDTKETKSEQKKLEIELRRKALESLRAKKAINP